ncbi:MAG TPA: HAMP domain-containing sensor histidine kinase [Saccharofermentans sp.]|nr:HAMP domain-containing histidine kinase [Clostridiaceae bacterium]HPG64829.1 HAMP domain-containing sensor histidine kinase [Saccharofermentans sp.]HUM24139.1 HAMP domain-containing sensor histidine kinase [Saccharofermentans sp.]
MNEPLQTYYIPFLIIASVIAICGAVIYAYIVNRKLSKTIDRLDSMIDKATDGEFKANEFSESKLSSLECKFANFLDSSLTSEANLDKEKEQIKTMISDISHQTKTPISNLLLYSELLGEEDLSETGKESIEVIHSQTEKLRFLVDSLVKLSRLENGIVMLSAENNSIRELLESVVFGLKNEATKRGLRLICPYKDGEDIRARFDMKWTHEAISNIVDNAIKYTSAGYVEISISSTDIFARIDIKDTGIGISEEDSARIFQRFYRSSEVAQEEGVGIGLYLAREIITAEGGYIKLRSKQNEGTTFSVFLPIN